MKSALVLSCLVLVALISSTTYADIARPKPSPEKEGRVVFHTGLIIEPDAKASEARLQIHQSELQELRAALDGLPRNNSFAVSVAHSSYRTIIAGLLLFVSISLAGIWLARSARDGSGMSRGQKTAVVLLLAAATVGAAAIITRANAGPPGYYRWRNLPQALLDGKPTAGGLDIEIIPDDPNVGTRMRLIIPLRKQAGQGAEE
jgi:heme A synthase